MRRLPYLIAALIPFQSILGALGLRYAVYALLAGSTGLYLLRALLQGRAAGGFRAIWVFVAWVAVLALARPGAVSVFGFLSYAMFPLFFMGYFYAYGALDRERLTRTNLKAATVIAVIGIYQYFLNPTLSGFSTYVGAGAEGVVADALRINSLMPSAMTLGAYLVLSALLALTLPERRRGTIVAVAICLLCALLTGNKSTILCLGAAVLYGMVDHGIRHHGPMRPVLYLACAALAYFGLLVTAESWGPSLLAFNGTLYRAVAPFFFIGDTTQGTTLLAYWAVLFLLYGRLGLSLLVGNGPGLTRQDTTFFGGTPLGDFPVAESYLVQVVFELGIVGFLILHLILWKIFKRARRERVPGRVGLDHVMVALWANMVVVHVFAGVFTGFLWGYFAAQLARQPESAPVPVNPPEAIPAR